MTEQQPANPATHQAPPVWISSGYRLLARSNAGLSVSDDYLRAYLLRPELVPIEESCDAERKLHASLMTDPGTVITPVTLLRIKDPDARENFEIFARFRDHLIESGSIASGYLRLFDGRNLQIPSLFVDQLAHAILAEIMSGESDPYLVRASECLFRAQKVSTLEGNLLLADQETLEQTSETSGLGNLGRLLIDAQAPLRTQELDVLGDGNKGGYFDRSGRFDMVLDATFGRPGLDALARVMERWINRFYPIGARIHPVQQIRDQRWIWHIGLEPVSTGILNDLFDQKNVEESRLERLIGLFRMEVDEPDLLTENMRGRSIYLGIAHDPDQILRLKPQNLLVNLPLKQRS